VRVNHWMGFARLANPRYAETRTWGTLTDLFKNGLFYVVGAVAKKQRLKLLH
jgi:hypothetical protein